MTKQTIILTTALAFSSLGMAASLKTDKQKISYAIGQQIGGQVKAQGIDIDPKVLAESINDAVAGKKSQMSDDEMMAAMGKLRDQAEQKQAELTKKNKEAADKFLAENKKKKDVKETKSGLQYTVLKAGSGAKPTATSEVKVHYRGTLLDGSEFDSSYKRNEPAEFPLGQVIPGWTEGLQLMETGAKYMFFIPPQLAYGERGRPGIPPNSLLVFEVELLEVK